MPTLYVIAGPNGCGNSTLTRMSGFSGIDIIDPDAIARGLGSDKHVQAAREALRWRRDALGAGRTHLVETTLTGSGILRHMTTARRKDYWIVLLYDNANPDRPFREVAVITEKISWIADAMPDWATAALDYSTASSSG